MPRDAAELSSPSEARSDSEAPKSGVRVLPAGVIPRPQLKSRPPGAAAALEAVPPPPLSRPGRAAVRPRALRPAEESPAVRLARRESSPESLSPLAAAAAPRRPLPPPSRANLARIAPPAPIPAPVAAQSAAEPAPAARARETSPSAPSLRDGLPAPASSNHAFRSLTTTAQDWPVVSAPLESSGVQSRGPTFGRPPLGAPDPSRFSLPPFLPPPGMSVEIRAANDDGDYAALDAAFVMPVVEAPALSPRLRTALIFGAGVLLGVLTTLVLH